MFVRPTDQNAKIFIYINAVNHTEAEARDCHFFMENVC